MKQLPGRQVLIVEDSGLIALELERTLLDEGAKVVGPVGSVADALSLLGHNALDGAVLDINLGDEDVFPVADALSAADIPFMFVTGHSDARVPPRHSGRPILRKPYLPAKMLSLLASILPQDRKRA